LHDVEYTDFVAYYVAACAPPVGSYDPKHGTKVQGAIIDFGDDRFKEPKCNFVLFLFYATSALFVVIMLSVACSKVHNLLVYQVAYLDYDKHIVTGLVTFHRSVIVNF